MTNTQELAMKILTKKAVREIKIDELTTIYETASSVLKSELSIEANILQAEVMAYHSVLQELDLSPKWLIHTMRDIKAEMYDAVS